MSPSSRATPRYGKPCSGERGWILQHRRPPFETVKVRLQPARPGTYSGLLRFWCDPGVGASQHFIYGWRRFVEEGWY
jgi:hypothetical protein